MSLSCESVLLHGKRDFADVTKDLEMGKSSWLIQAQRNDQGASKQTTGRSGSQRGGKDGSRNQRGKKTQCSWLQRWKTGSYPKERRGPPGAGKGSETDHHLELPEETSPGDTSASAQ